MSAKDEVAVLRGLHEVVRNVEVIQLICDEVNNGGFLQYYTNSSRFQYVLVEDAIKAVGMPKLLKIAKKANDIIRKILAKGKYTIADDIDFTDKEAEKLSALDDAFYELDGDDDPYTVLENYVKANFQEEI
jgi:hypothetical protein